MVLIVVPVTVGSLVMALLINASSPRVRVVVGTIILLPFVTAPAITTIVFRSLYAETGELNGLLDALSLPTVGWLSEPTPARIAVAGIVAWSSLGFNTMLMLAGLQRIPRELGDAAAVDGATTWKTVRHITVPLMIPIMLFVSVITVFATFNLFAEPKLLTGGGPANATLTPGLAIYSEGFGYGRFGTAAALGLAFAMVALLIGVLQLRVGRERR
jgi:ABC-type sugar transport system permease subunit